MRPLYIARIIYNGVAAGLSCALTGDVKWLWSVKTIIEYEDISHGETNHSLNTRYHEKEIIEFSFISGMYFDILRNANNVGVSWIRNYRIFYE